MNRPLTAQDIVDDIEFELAQGAISRDDLGQAIQAVRQYQNRLRSEAFASGRSKADSSEVLSRLFLVNDTLVTLLQEMSASIQATQLDVRRLGQVLPRRQPPEAERAPGPEPTGGAIALPAGAERAAVSPQPGIGVDDVVTSEGLPEGPSLAELESAMRPEALWVDLHVRSAEVPVIGWLIRRLRVFLHVRSILYARLLAERQASVNRVYGDWLLRVNQADQRQQEQIRRLSAQVAMLQARLDELATAPGPSDARSAGE